MKRLIALLLLCLIAAACDAGLIELYEGDWLDALTRKIESL